MDDSTEKRIKPYYGRNNLDYLLWASAAILDSERELQSNSGYLGHKVEWCDDEDRHCELRAKIHVPNAAMVQHVGSAYAYTQYMFLRRNNHTGKDSNFVISSNTKTVTECDATMRKLPVYHTIGQRAAIYTILDSYDAFGYPELITDQESEIYADIVAGITQTRLQKARRKLSQLLLGDI